MPRSRPDRFDAHKLGADYINERFDLYVIPLANAFRMRFQDSLARMTDVLEKLTIPVVILGVGLGGRYPYVPDERQTVDANVARFLRAVMDRCASIGVRGEFTEDYVRRLGFKDVEIIGCPSMYLDGERIAVTKRTATLEGDARIAINITPRVRSAGPIVMSHLARYPNLTFVAQASETLELLLYGRDRKGVDPNDPMPTYTSHPLLRDGRTRYLVDPWPWLDYLRSQDFAFGLGSTGTSLRCWPGRPASSLGTMHGPWSWPDTSRSRIGSSATYPPMSTQPTSMPKPTTARCSAATPLGSEPLPTTSLAMASATCSKAVRISPHSIGESPGSTTPVA